LDIQVIDTTATPWTPHHSYPGVAMRPLIGSDVSSAVEVRIARLEPGAEIALHTHPHSAETFYFLCGEGTLSTGDRSYLCHAGFCIHAPVGAQHSVKNTGTGDLQLLAIFTPPAS
jgi:mannose-6-phosphate isomerase-like protein (cupin superfamily)